MFSKERTERLINKVYFVILPVLLGLVMFGLYVVIQTNRTLEAQNKKLTSISEELQKESDEQTRQLQCITKFFAQNDRASLIITDVDRCFTARTN